MRCANWPTRPPTNSSIENAGSSGTCRTPRPPPRSITRGTQPSSARARAAKPAIQSTVISDAPKCISCEPTCTCSPSVAGASLIASSASSGGSPNFDPWCAVFTASWVSASIPGVTRISSLGEPRASVRSSSSRESIAISAPGRGCLFEQPVLLVVPVHHEPIAGQPCPPGELELADGRDVAPKALLGEDPLDRNRRERLRPVDDECAGGCGLVGACLAAQGHLVVDDERRPEPLGELACVDAAEGEAPALRGRGVGQQFEDGVGWLHPNSIVTLGVVNLLLT